MKENTKQLLAKLSIWIAILILILVGDYKTPLKASPSSVEKIIYKDKGGEIETPDKRFSFSILPETLTQDAIILGS